MKLSKYIISKLQASVVAVVTIDFKLCTFFFVKRSINTLTFFLLFWVCDN